MKAYNLENKAGNKKGKVITFAFHAIIVGFLLFPFLMKPDIIEEEFTTVLINFDSGSSQEGAQPEVKEKVVEKAQEKVAEKVVTPVEVPKVEAQPVVTSEDPKSVRIPDAAKEVKEAPVVEEVKEVAAPVENKAEVSAEAGNGKGKVGKGDAEKGKGAPGVGDGAFEGIGNLERKITYRPNLKQLASNEGVVSFIVCVNRAGMVTNVVFDPDYTTIKDKKVINEALQLASEFRFENKYAGPATECGRLQVKITHAY